ncbi:MAG TPA: hypothetical protein VF058_08640 [Actinomycetota bacterium]
MSDELEPQGIKRREFIRKAAVTGATVAWAAPVVRTLAGAPAFAQTATPQGKDFSYIALCISCNGSHCRIKIDLDDNGNKAQCETGDSFQTPGCSLSCGATSNCPSNACADIQASSADGGATVTVTLPPGCSIPHDGVAVGKCGNPPENGECVETFVTGTDGSGRTTVTFSMCDV